MTVSTSGALSVHTVNTVAHLYPQTAPLAPQSAPLEGSAEDPLIFQGLTK